ncbi:YqjF family protein [Streptomyces sp. NPDC003016]
MVSYGAEQRLRLRVLRADWLNQAFVHWPYRPADIQALLPGRLRADTYDGTAWVTLTPFLMADVRPAGVPSSVPALGTFLETNLRTYVRGPDGRQALWFLTIEVSCPAMLAARAVGAPYHQGSLSLRRDDGICSYSGARRGGGGAYRLAVRYGAPVTPSERDVWLTTRWHAFTRRAGLVWDTPVEHAPWPLHTGAVENLTQSLTTAVGLPAPSRDPLVHFSPGVRRVRIGPSRPRWRAAGPARGALRN